MTGRNTPQAVRKTKGLRNSREEPPHPRWRKEAGGGERGKLSPREATPSHPANRPRFLSEDFLRPDRRRALGPRTAHVQRAPTPWLPEPLKPGKTQNTGATESALLWRTRKLELHATQGLLHIEQPGA